GTLTLLGNNSYTGGTTISAGTLQIGDGTTDGTIVGDVVDNGSFVINNQNDTALSGAISGSGSLTQAGGGTLTLSGKNSYTGDTNLNNGVISVAQEDNLGTGGALNFNGGMLRVTGTDFSGTNRAISWGASGGGFDIADANNSFVLSNVFTGFGGLTKDGAGTLALSGDSSGFTGNTTVNAGSLRLDGGSLGIGTVHVASGSSLGGHGSIAGAVDIAAGGTLFGTSGQQLAFGNGLTLGANSNVDVTISGGSAVPALFSVNGNLALDGKLNIDAGSAVDIGVYRIFDYTGSLTGSLTIGTVSDGDVANYSLQNSINHQVNLVSTGGRDFLFWDGDAGPKNDGHVNGGTGTWNAGNDNWTGSDGTLNASWHNDTFTVFEGTPGNVTIDGGFKPQVNGMQFMTTGYVLDGGAFTLGGTGAPLIIVGDGSVASVNTTAEIGAGIEGNQGLTKSGAGNLILTGASNYTGDTTIQQGTLTLRDGGSLNNQSNIVLGRSAYGDGVLVI
ncbi:autotransporter-associated beta strand repeat-containing protein, partial [Brucella anthropi]|uniref:autotransporter-associated beta strand repeat-containing protein n=1 Tax=Brucella anthropi TaxID=529 RepID=UPI002362402A